MKFSFGWGFATYPTGTAHSAPQTPSWIWGKRREKGREGKGGEGKKGKGKEERDGKGKGEKVPHTFWSKVMPMQQPGSGDSG